MNGHSSEKSQRRSRALVPAERRLAPVPIGAKQVELPAPAARKRVFGRALKIGGVVVGLCVTVILALNILAASDFVEARVAAWIKKQSGGELAVNGETRLSFLPAPYIEITDAVIDVPNAVPGSAALTVAKLGIYLGFKDLFAGGTSAERIVLEQPVLTLSLGGAQRAALPLSKPASRTSIQFTKAQTSARAHSLEELQIGELRIANGAVIFQDADARIVQRIKHIYAYAALPGLRDPFSGRGRLDWHKERVGFRFEMATLAQFRAKQPVRLAFELDGASAVSRFNGTLSAALEIAGKGRLSVQANSISKFASWLAGTPYTASGLGAGELAGAISWEGQKIAFSETVFTSAHARGNAEGSVRFADPRPHIDGAVTLDYLNISPFLTSAQHSVGTANLAAQMAPGASAGPPTREVDWFSAPAAPATVVEHEIVPLPPSPKEQVLDGVPRLTKPAPGVSQPSLTIAMPQNAIDRVLAETVPQKAAPSLFDADVNFDVRKVRAGHLSIGQSSLGVAFKDGRLAATLWGMALYGGNARGTLNAEMMTPSRSFVSNLRLDGVNAGPLLMDAAQFGMLQGSTRLTLSITGEGADSNAVLSSLRGNGAFVVNEGAIEGMNVPALIEGLGQGRLDLRQGANAKTPFDTLSASFVINQGIARTRNLKLKASNLEVAGAGSIDIAGETIDLLTTPKIIAGADGSSRASDLAGLAVPLRIQGPLSGPRVRPELGAVFADTGSSTLAGKIGAALKAKFGGKPVGEIIGGLLGSSITAGARAEQAQPQALGPALSIAPKNSTTQEK